MTIDLNNIYPKNIGEYLTKTIFPLEQIPILKSQLKQKVVISLDGLAGVGKGTVGKAVSGFLEIPHLHSGLIYRALTYIYQDLLLPLSDQNTDLVISKIQAGVEDGAIKIYYKGRFLKDGELRNELIDQHINEYNNNLYVRSKIDEALTNVVLYLHENPFIIDLRGATPPYIKAAEEAGFLVIRLLLTAQLEEKVRRRFKEYIDTAKKLNPLFQLSDSDSQRIYEEVFQAIVRRDTQDVESIIQTGIGLIHEKSGVIDTTDLTVDEVIGTTFQFISDSLKNRYN